MSERNLVTTLRVKVGKNSIYAHVTHDGPRIIEVAISSPGKFQETEIGSGLEELSLELTKEIIKIQEEGNVVTLRPKNI